MPGPRQPESGSEPGADSGPDSGQGAPGAEPAADPGPLIVTLYIAEGATTCARLAADAPLLDADESARAARVRDPEARADYQAAHVLLRHALSAASRARGWSVAPAAWRFRRAPGGRPGLAEPAPEAAPGHAPVTGRLRFNLSHTRGLVCCALAWDAAVGVDAERHRPRRDLLALARRYFTAAEATSLAVLDDPLASFYALWTLKEAHLKASGRGLADGLDRLGFRLAAGPPGTPATIESTQTGPAPRARAALLRPADGAWSIAVAVATPRAVRVVPRVVGAGAPPEAVGLTPLVAVAAVEPGAARFW